MHCGHLGEKRIWFGRSERFCRAGHDAAHALCYSVFANREYRMPQPSLRPQDILVLVKLLSYQGRRPPMAQMALELSISSSEVHAALKRLVVSRLVSNDANGNRPLLEAVEEFLVHGVKFAFPARRGEVTRGVPTSYAAPPLNKEFESGSELPPVWPYPEGQHRGVSLEPFIDCSRRRPKRSLSLRDVGFD